MDFLTLTLELFRNADHFIMYIAQTYGWWVYLVLFMIFYSETGIVICAFLPGDSLLFIAGAAAAAGALNPWLLIVIISLGAILGNTTNFYIGNWLGNKIYDGSISWIDQDALKKTHDFYEKHGGKTIVLNSTAEEGPLFGSAALSWLVTYSAISLSSKTIFL